VKQNLGIDVHWSVGTGHISGARSRQCMWHE